MKKILLGLLILGGVLLFTSCQNTSKEFETINTSQVSTYLEDSNAVVVDTRINDAYNGWKLDGVARGGHIPGATDFSANWINTKADKKDKTLDTALDNKGISKDKTIVLYDANGKDALTVANFLAKKGYAKIYIYNVNDWANDASLPLETYPNYEQLVPAKIVKEILDGKTPETFSPDKKIKIIEASWGEESESYSLGHIPGSFHINTDSIEPPPAWMLADDQTLLAFAASKGLTKDDCVILTGQDQMASYRVAIVLKYLGISDVRVLNGGLKAWTEAGYELETTSNSPTPVSDFGATSPLKPELINTTAEVKSKLNTPGFTLVDNRTWEEHIGKISGYSYYDKTGRIPGAIFGFAGQEGSGSVDFYTNLDGTMRNQEEIRSMLTSAGINLDTHLSLMCGSGWRVSQILTYLQVMGLSNASIYSDGWIGWSSDPANPTITGLEDITFVPDGK